jgi:hypothetical protein
MASSYSTDLKLELMVTGENAGLWGNITNTNLNILQQSIAGYESVTLNATTGATLAFTNGALSNGKNAVLDLAGTLTSSVNVIIPDSIEKTYIVKNSTSGSFAVTFKTTSGTGATFAAADKGIKVLYSDGTNIVDVNANLAASSFEQINLPTQNELRFEDSTGGQYVALKAGTTVATNVTFTLPTADGTSNQVITTNGSGVLSFATVSGGAAWQPVVTSSLTVVAKGGYFVNTSGGVITATLPGSPTIGDFVSFIDYNGTFDTNNLTVARNGNPIQGDASDLTVAVERAGFTLVYVDATQGWLLQNK